MPNLTLYADIYPSGHKSIMNKIAEKIASGEMPPLTGVISPYDSSNNYWKTITNSASHAFVEPPATKTFYKKEIVPTEGGLVLQKKIPKEAMGYPEYWQEIILDSICEAMRLTTKSEGVIAPAVDICARSSWPLEELKANPGRLLTGQWDLAFVKFNREIAKFVLSKVREKNATRKVYGSIFLDSRAIESEDFLEVIDSYKDIPLAGYVLMMGDIDWRSDLTKLVSLKNFIARLAATGRDREIILYRVGMLGVVYSALFPDLQLGSTYGLPYRDSYSIRSISPAEDPRPLKNAKQVYVPEILKTVTLADAIQVWDTLHMDFDRAEATENQLVLVTMAKDTQNFVHEMNGSRDKKAYLSEKLDAGIALTTNWLRTLDTDHGFHLKTWRQLLQHS